jgi:hypothetical protein
VIILEGRGGRDWLGFALKLQRVLEAFQMAYGGGKRPSTLVRCELAIVVDKRLFAEVVVGQRQRGGSSSGHDMSSPKA